MIDCADSTTLRAHLDHADPSVEAHLDECQECTGLLHSVAEDAGYVQRALISLAPLGAGDEDGEVDVEAALAAVRGRTLAPVVALAPPAARGHDPSPSSSGRRLVLAAAAAMVVLFATVTPAGRSAVAQALDAFRGGRLQAVTVDLDALEDSIGPDLRALAALGDVDTRSLTEPQEVASTAEAEAISSVRAPTFDGRPDHLVALAPGTVRLTFATRAGNGVPAHLDGAALVVEVPGAIVAAWGGDDGPPDLVVGHAGALEARGEGASLDEIRSFVLSRDELPADLRAQLASIEDWRSTIPVPVPLDGPGWRDVEVGGRPAIAFGDDTGLGALVIRQDPDGVTVVGGRIAMTRALALAARA